MEGNQILKNHIILVQYVKWRVNNIKKLSIVVVAYNHLEYTKSCIESILKYTLNIDYELIVVNNGSSDGTKIYLDSLENVKTVDLEDNKGSGGGFNFGFKACCGEYVLFVSNDLILTPNWANNLLYCIESNERIGMVVPTCNYSSNWQSTAYNFTGMDEMIEFARNYNISNKLKWEERIRLITYAWIIKRDLYEAVGGLDSNFNGGFDDDDLSFRIRRRGYKLILARDTFVYHFGSVTTSQNYNSLLSINREKFLRKYNIDAWDDTGFDTNTINFIECSESNKEVNILGINPQCGANILQIKNKFIERGIENVNLYGFTEDERYGTDLRTICCDVISDDINGIDKYFQGKKFDYIVIQSPIENIHNLNSIFDSLNNIVEFNGKIIFSLKNIGFFQNAVQFLTQKPFNNTASYEVNFIEKDGLIRKLKDIGYTNIRIMTILYYGYQSEMDLITNIAKCFDLGLNEVVKQNMQIYEYKFCISKA